MTWQPHASSRRLPNSADMRGPLAVLLATAVKPNGQSEEFIGDVDEELHTEFASNRKLSRFDNA